jgi:hypothetical protein
MPITYGGEHHNVIFMRKAIFRLAETRQCKYAKAIKYHNIYSTTAVHISKRWCLVKTGQSIFIQKRLHLRGIFTGIRYFNYGFQVKNGYNIDIAYQIVIEK